MIVAAGRMMAASLAAALASAPAQADVLEVGPGGEARWVAGPRSGAADEAAPDAPQPLAALQAVHVSDLAVPEDALAVPALHARGIPPAYAAKVAELADRFDLSPALIEALVWQESRWRADAVSPAGARGLAQLMPGTARELGVDPADPLANLEGGARYLRAQLDRFDGDLEKALAAYNAGPGRVLAAGGIPRIRETQTYVASVLRRLSNHARSPR